MFALTLLLFFLRIPALCLSINNKCNSLQSKQEALVLEINVLINEVKNALLHLKEWTKPEKVRNRT
jgi:hypothetical protein